MDGLKSIFEYDDYRAFLRDYYTYAKSKDAKFSFRFLSRVCGFSSSGALKLIMDGKRNTSPQYVPKIAKALKLNREESIFFGDLIRFNQSSDSGERKLLAEKMMQSKTYKKLHPLKPAQYRFYEKWYFPVVRELVVFEGFKEDPEWIARQIQPAITPKEAKQALEELIQLGILARDERGRLRQSNAAISNIDQLTSAAFSEFHREMAKRAAESIDRVTRDKRELMTFTFSVSEEKLKKIKELAREFRTDLVEIVTSGATDAGSVYELNIHVFPLSRVIEGGENT